jgi:hypothetical protein
MRWGFGIWFGLLALSQLLPVSARLQIGAGALTLLMCAHGAQAVLGWHWIRQLQGAERAGRVLESRTPQESRGRSSRARAECDGSDDACRFFR